MEATERSGDHQRAVFRSLFSPVSQADNFSSVAEHLWTIRLVGIIQLDAALPDLACRKRRTRAEHDEHHYPTGDAEPGRDVSRLSLLWLVRGQAGPQTIFDSLYA